VPLSPQKLAVSFDKGLNTKVDPKQILPGEMLILQNGMFISPKEITEDAGSMALSTLLYNTPGNITAGNSIHQFQNELILSDNEYLYNFSETEQKWVAVQTPGGQRLSQKVANSISSLPVGYNAAFGSGIGMARDPVTGIEAYVWGGNYLTGQPGTNITFVLLDTVNGTTLFQTTYNDGLGASNEFGFNVFIFGTIFYFTVQDSTTPNVELFNINFASATPTLSGPTLLIPTTSAIPSVVGVQSATQAYTLSAAAGGGVFLNSYSSSMINTGTVAIGGAATTALALAIDPSGNLYPMWFDGSSVWMGIYSPTLVAIIPARAILSSAATVQLAGTWINTSQFYLFFESAIGSAPHLVTEVIVSLATLAANILLSLFNVRLASNAFLYNGTGCVAISFVDMVPVGTVQVIDQALYVVLQFTGVTLATATYTQLFKFSENTAGRPSVKLYSVATIGTTQVVIPYLRAVQNSAVGGVITNFYNVDRCLDTLFTRIRSVELGDNLNLSGGIVSIYDGLGVAESGFTVFPTQGALTGSSTTGGFISSGTYSYVVTYEWIDDEGNLHRSAPSAGIPVVVGGSTTTETLFLTVNGTSLSEFYKIRNIQVVFWRTQNGGTIFYKVGSSPNLDDPVSFTDISSDATIANNTQLYTNGGEVENIAPPASDILVPFKNRLIAVQADTPLTWWYSKQVVGDFPAEFSDLFTQNVDELGGPIRAMGVLDDKLILFKNSNIFYVIGDGPAPSGVNNDFSFPQIITSDVGCINQDSIVTIPIGLIFQSTRKGIFLLGRDLSLTYIGARVEEFNSFLVTGSSLLANTTQVRLSLNTNVILIYDYLVNQWAIHSGLSYVDTTIYKHLYTGLQSNGVVLEQTEGLFTDNGVPLALSLTTGWFSFAELDGYQRVWRFVFLATAVNATSLQVTTAVDFDPTPVQTDVIPILASTVPQDFRIFPIFQKCTAMQITMVEIPTGSAAGGLTLSGLSFDLGVKKGVRKLPAAVSYG
jgi:hypothetical protein